MLPRVNEIVTAADKKMKEAVVTENNAPKSKEAAKK